MNITIDNLPSKFHPFLLGHEKCKKNIDLEPIFKKPLVPLKDNYIFDAGDWVLKLGRTDGLFTTPDTHLYRIRKAEKIRHYIVANHLEDHLMVPEKYLYWNKDEEKFYVVSEKVDLSDEVATLASEEIAEDFEMSDLKGQVGAFNSGKPQRAITPVQAKALAELSCLGYTDLNYNNLYFTLDGRVAIIDTEPLKRGLKKTFAKNFISSWTSDKEGLLAQQSIAGIAKLKTYCEDPEALEEAEKVEKHLALWSMAKLIGKIVIASLMIYATPRLVRQLPIGSIAATALKVTLIALIAIKLLLTIMTALSVYMIWNFSHNGLRGVGQIVVLETEGHL